MSTNHTPRTPWNASGNWIMSQDGMVCYLNSIEVRGQFTEEQRDTTAAHIVHCVNSHDALLAALKGLAEKAKGLSQRIYDRDYDCDPEEKTALFISGGIDEMEQAISAAIAAAEPKAEGKG